MPQARVSAAMEAIELFHAERKLNDVELACFSQLGRGNAVDPRDLSLLRDGTQELPDIPIHWVQGHDLIKGRPVRVPRDLVSCDLRRNAPTDGLFLTSSNGLGAGNTKEEAILHAVCEVVERDATCLHQAASARFGGEPALVDPDTINDPLCLWLMERITSAEIDLHVWVQLGDLPIPSFGCAISDRHGGKFPGAPIGTFQGYGCHPDRGIALSRAITEAVQSRLTYIAGARDDLFRDDYASIQTARNRRGWLSWLEGKGPMMDFRRSPSWASDAVSFDLETMLEILARQGFDQVVSVDLTLSRIGIPVVKVIIPGLVEPTIGNQAPRGKRVDGFLERLNLSMAGMYDKRRMGYSA